jgi:hypothetical protein
MASLLQNSVQHGQKMEGEKELQFHLFQSVFLAEVMFARLGVQEGFLKQNFTRVPNISTGYSNC